MGLFTTKTEDELQKLQTEFDARARALTELEADSILRAGRTSVDEGRLTGEWTTLKEWRAQVEEAIAQRKGEILDAEQRLALREAEAKAGFVEQQRQAFKEVIDERVRQLDARQAEMDKAMAQRLWAFDARESACAERERGLQLRDDEALERHSQLEQRADELRKREGHVASAEKERDAGFGEARRAVDLECRDRIRELEARAEQLRRREEVVARAEVERDEGFTEARRAFEAEMHGRRQEIEREIDRLRSERLKGVQDELAKERLDRREALNRDLEEDRAAVSGELRKLRQAFNEEHDRVSLELATAQAIVDRRQSEVTTKERGLDHRQKILEAREGRVEERELGLNSEVDQRVEHRQSVLDAAEAGLEDRRQALEDEVEAGTALRKASYDSREASLQAEVTRLRTQIQGADKAFGLFDTLKRQLGGRDAEQVLADFEAQQSALRDLREKIGQQTPEMSRQFEALRSERDRLQASIGDADEEMRKLRDRLKDEPRLRVELEETATSNRSLTVQRDTIQVGYDQLHEKLKRLQSTYERDDDRGKRIEDIETRDIAEIERMPLDAKVDELQWLAGIDKSCIDYGLRFHPRILKAFHTALKTAEWSPLTILAGVSGTGKSELPRLYAHFGGMTFKSIPVQPNWDSQESMLGFFNSIDNKFDAQPVLRLLARSQRPWTDENHGLKDSMVMILLDEMNLAHAELYFAEFLSKLELRRGSMRDPPMLEVKLGAGVPPYEVPMGRNVLWTGTMNQDETTKSLSDKVLDRSIVINFPRPSSLERRKKLEPLPPPGALLPRKVWQSWWVKESVFKDDEILPFKQVIEDINEAMAKVGRALGHRVWQSVEYYMANYPDTLAAQGTGDGGALQRAMRDAFEDQLVQKVMPKLRGIDTRGRSKTDCLDKVRDLLVANGYGIVEDFDQSCERGYGQFMWQTVSFLQEGSTANRPSHAGATALVAPLPAEAAPDVPGATAAGPQPPRVPTEDDPPDSFQPDDPDAERRAKWKKLNPKKREKHRQAERAKKR